MYHLEKGDSFIDFIDEAKNIDFVKIDSNFISANIKLKSIVFSTLADFGKVFNTFKPFLGNDVGYFYNDGLRAKGNYDSITGEDNSLVLRDVSDRLIKKLDNSKKSFFCSSSKIKGGFYIDYFTFEKPNYMNENGSYFGFNLQSYRGQEILKPAFGLTDYPLEKRDIKLVKSFFE